MIASFCRAGSIALLLPGAAHAADGVTTIQTPGFGTLTICVNWIPLHGCRSYDHVTLPQRVAVGDKVPLEFGGDPNHYDFPVVRIIKNGLHCTVVSDTNDDGENSDSIKVPSCLDVSDSH
jgi:hypothetical protein